MALSDCMVSLHHLEALALRLEGRIRLGTRDVAVVVQFFKQGTRQFSLILEVMKSAVVRQRREQQRLHSQKRRRITSYFRFTDTKQRRIDSYFTRISHHETFVYGKDKLQGEITEDSRQDSSLRPSVLADEELLSAPVTSIRHGRPGSLSRSEGGLKKYRRRTRREHFEARFTFKWGARKMRTPAVRQKQKELMRRKVNGSEHAILRSGEESSVGTQAQDGRSMMPVEGDKLYVSPPLNRDEQEEFILPQEQENTTTSLEPTTLEECETPDCTPVDLLSGSTSENTGQKFDTSSLDLDIVELMKTFAFLAHDYCKEDTRRSSRPLTDPVREAGEVQCTNPESILDRLTNASRSVSCLLQDLNPRIEAALTRVTDQVHCHGPGDTGAR